MALKVSRCDAWAPAFARGETSKQNVFHQENRCVQPLCWWVVRQNFFRENRVKVRRPGRTAVPTLRRQQFSSKSKIDAGRAGTVGVAAARCHRYRGRDATPLEREPYFFGSSFSEQLLMQ